MARARQFDKDIAIDKVMNEIWKHGYEASSVKSLSEKLGITRSSFYNSFGSRENLFREVLKHYLSVSPDRVMLSYEEASSPLSLIYELFKEVIKVRLQDSECRGCLVINCASELIGNHSELGPELTELITFSEKRFEKILHHCVAINELPEDFPVIETALALQQLLMGLNTITKVVRSKQKLLKSVQVSLRGLGLLMES